MHVSDHDLGEKEESAFPEATCPFPLALPRTARKHPNQPGFNITCSQDIHSKGTSTNITK